MAVNLSPYGGVGAQFLDNAGNVLTGGKIFTYLAGTTTLQATYTTPAGNIFHSNPIILDASGRVPAGGEIWLTDGLSYKFVLTDSNDVLIATYDNISGINSNFIAFTNQQEIQIATAGQTVFNLTTTTYQPGTNSLSVFVDGVNQYGPGAQYAYLETDSDTITFVNGLHVGAQVKFTTSQLNSSGLQANAFQVSYTPPFTGSVGTNVGNKLAQTVSVKDFGAVGDGVTNDTAAIQAAINSSAGFLSVYFPTGTYKITSQITISNDRVMLYGDGSASKILFVPTTNAVCFLFDKGSTSSVQNTVRDLTFYSTDTTYTKTAIKLVDVSSCLVENVQTVFPHWFGNGSTFLHILGRDTTAIRGINVFSDKPIRVSPIPLPHVAAGIGIDHFHFSDCYLGNTTSANPIITFDDAVIITNVTFDGYQAWVGGSHGFYWNSPTATQASLNLSFNNVRWEQAISGGYVAYVSSTSGLSTLNFTNCYSGDGTSVGAKGYFLRNIEQFAFRSVFYTGPSIGLDADANCSNGNFDLFLNDPTSTLNLSAKRLTGTIRQGGNIFNYSPSVPSGSGITQNWNPSKTLGFNQLEPKTFTVPASSTVTFSEDSLKGLVFIYASLSVSAVMAVNGSTHTTKLLVASDAGWFGTSVGAANINLYWDAGSSLYKLQVNIASNVTFNVVTMGTGER
jgi:hypothetical protein